jgi:hypothetical protein
MSESYNLKMEKKKAETCSCHILNIKYIYIYMYYTINSCVRLLNYPCFKY